MVRTIGVDPGVNGALVCVDWDDLRPYRVQCEVMPVLVAGKTKKTKQVDRARLRDLLDEWHNLWEGPVVDYVVLENQHAFPGQGVTSMFSLGMSFGCLAQVLIDLRLPHEIVPPQTWQKYFGIGGGGTKDQALRVAQARWPMVDLRASTRARLPHDGVVDALLMARYAVTRLAPRKS